jgi:hypothetical protein
MHLSGRYQTQRVENAFGLSPRHVAVPERSLFTHVFLSIALDRNVRADALSAALAWQLVTQQMSETSAKHEVMYQVHDTVS